MQRNGGKISNIIIVVDGIRSDDHRCWKMTTLPAKPQPQHL